MHHVFARQVLNLFCRDFIAMSLPEVFPVWFRREIEEWRSTMFMGVHLWRGVYIYIFCPLELRTKSHPQK